MPTNDIVSPWIPMTDPVDCKVLGKLMEESGELCSAAARCFIQGIDEAEPITGKVNREWLQDELADVQASIEVTIERFALDAATIAERKERKKALLRQWHKMGS